MITGGCCHDYPRQQEIIPNGIAARTSIPIDWTVVLDASNGGKIPFQASADWAKDYDVVVHNECHAGVTDKDWVENILKPHREGTPAVVVHCAMHSYRTGDEAWFDFLGVTSHRHGARYPFEVRNLATDNPIMKSFGDSWMTPQGELYLISKLGERTTPLAHAFSRDSKKNEVCIWTNQYGKARVFGTTLGHHNETMAAAPFLDTVTRGLLWSVDRLDDVVLRDAPAFDLTTVAHIASATRKPKKGKKAKKPKVQLPTGQAPDNLALGRKASAPKSQKPHPPQNAVDGDLETRWCSPNGAAGHPWQVDLGHPQELSGARIVWEAGVLYQYTVEGSADGKTWSMLSDQRKRTKREQVHQLTFTAKSIRHIRVITTKLQGSWGSFWEFEAHGTKLVDGTAVAAKPKKAKNKAEPKKAEGLSISGPKGLEFSEFSGPARTPCVACIGVTPAGVVYAGVDRIGSLGKGSGKGRIIRLTDANHDGVHDSHSVFAVLDNPRGILPFGDKVYVLHTEWSGEKTFVGMHLSVLTDANADGKADGPPRYLVKDISTRKSNEQRGADHTTNGIRMGIDGWIYVAVGDYGFVDATGSDGTKLTMYGGGIVRVRPDGSELETYTHGMRNIYDVAIDPYLNLFTFGNTNDGGGWNVRFNHHVQTGEYGYPTLFKRYTSEIIPALVDLGGGSGTGSMFFDEPGWPAAFTAVPMMCDWGRGQLFIHRVTEDGPSFTQEQEAFINCRHITDVDCDASGRLFIGSWGTSGFSGGSDGFVARVVPKGWTYKEFPALKGLNDADLSDLLTSASTKARQHAQQEILRRGGNGAEVRNIALDASVDPKARIAAMYTLKQLLGPGSHADLLALADDSAVAEHALRALADRKSQVAGVPLRPFIEALTSDNQRVRSAAAVALGRLGDKAAASALLSISNPPAVDPLPVQKQTTGAVKKNKANQSPLITGTKTHTFDVEIKGWKTLVLSVDDGGDTTGSDHGAWFEPTLVKIDGSILKLTDLDWTKATQGWGSTGVGISPTGNPLARADKKPLAFGIGTHSAGAITWRLPSDAARIKVEAGLASTAGGGGSVRFHVGQTAPAKVGNAAKNVIAEGPHAEPNPDSIVPHVARQALVALRAGEACVDAIGGPDQAGALMAMRYMHSPQVVDALIARLESSSDSDTKQRIARTLVRLANREKPFTGETWWHTRPDTRGPYYYPTPWDKSAAIEAALLKAADSGDPALRYVIAALATKDRVEIAALSKTKAATKAAAPEQPSVDLEAIKNQQGQIGKMGLEDILIAIGKIKGKPSRGRALYTQQGCMACHALSMDEVQKGPYLGQIGSIMDAEKIAHSILRPNAEISQGFKTAMIRTKKGAIHLGFVTERLSDSITIRNIAGMATVLDPADIAEETLMPTSMMPPGLANGMSLQDFASLVHFLASMKK